MKLLLSFLIGMLAFTLLAETKKAPIPNPLIGTWVLDVAKTSENRKNIKELPPGLDFKPKPENVIARTLIFNETSFSALVAGVKSQSTSYKIIKTDGNGILVRYDPTEKANGPVYCWWEFPTEGTAINYPSVFRLSDPRLNFKGIKDIYEKRKANHTLHPTALRAGFCKSADIIPPAQSRMLLPQPPRLRLAPFYCHLPLPESRG
jgi:hypothetical protein